MKPKEKLSVVVPVYNGSKSLKTLCKNIFHTGRKGFESVEIILVDDASVDDSYSVMRELRNSDNRIKLIKLRQNVGQQNATFCGMQYAAGDLIATLDDDLQHPPKILLSMKKEIDKGAELVFAVPNQQMQKRYRRLGSRLTYLAFNFILKRNKPVRISSCRMFAAGLKPEQLNGNTAFVYVSAELMKKTDSIAWVPFGQEERVHGQSNYTFSKLLKIFANLIIYYSEFKILRRFRKRGKLYEIERLEMEGDAE
ncbi:MAG: glycosyltransferase [Peptostreptococcaceae bacterium]|nr:glycosyltransferase [Peptostreptococcaceae bacterium]